MPSLLSHILILVFIWVVLHMDFHFDIFVVLIDIYIHLLPGPFFRVPSVPLTDNAPSPGAPRLEERRSAELAGWQRDDNLRLRARLRFRINRLEILERRLAGLVVNDVDMIVIKIKPGYFLIKVYIAGDGRRWCAKTRDPSKVQRVEDLDVHETGRFKIPDSGVISVLEDLLFNLSSCAHTHHSGTEIPSSPEAKYKMNNGTTLNVIISQ